MEILFMFLTGIAAFVLVFLAFYKGAGQFWSLLVSGLAVILGIVCGVLADDVYKSTNEPSAMDLVQGKAKVIITEDNDTLIVFNEQIGE